MSESYQSPDESPLQSGRGTTTISDGVVSKIAGISAQEVDGVHMGGSATRTAGGLLQNITGSESQTRGVSVEVGKIETAIDLKMGIDYGKNILQTVDEVRRRIIERIQNMTGLKVTELNVTIADVVFPEGDGRGRLASGTGTRGLEAGRPQTRTLPRTEELRPGAADRETTPVEPRSRTYTEGASGPLPEEEVRVEGRPLDEDETAELRAGETTFEEQRTGEESDTRAQTQAPETETRETETPETEAEARRRRAEERARRRGQPEDSEEG